MEKTFFFLYSLFAFLLYFLALPFLLLFSFKTKYKASIPARFFLWKNSTLKPNGVWFHSCSFGEAKAIKPLVDRLPPELLRMSSTTQTGYEAINAYTKESRYLPFEALLFFWMRPQKVLVVMEAEFWYLLFALARKRGAKTMLINARMSERSYPKYLRMKWLYVQIFKYIDEVYAQTEIDRERLASLGAKNIVVMGNIKLSSLPSVTKTLMKPVGMTLCAASTHEGEEGLILDAFSTFKQVNAKARLIVVPRHPERFDKVASMIDTFSKKEKLTWHRYSENERLEDDIVLVDTLGELVNIYAICDIVILGGAFKPIGGHNAAEAAQFGCKIISGKHYFNQVDIFEAVEGITIVEASNLSRRLLQHGLLKPTKLKSKTDISPIVESINSAIISK